jgi:hypothetical protein
MTWALSKLCKIFAIAYSLRSTLKLLKSYSLHKTVDNIHYGTLMFWTIFGVFVFWEEYIEYFIKWFPLYHYGKSFFILIMAFHRMNFTKYVFNNLYVPMLHYMHVKVVHYSQLIAPYRENFTLALPFIALTMLIFPAMYYHDNSNSVSATNPIESSLHNSIEEEARVTEAMCLHNYPVSEYVVTSTEGESSIAYNEVDNNISTQEEYHNDITIDDNNNHISEPLKSPVSDKSHHDQLSSVGNTPTKILQSNSSYQTRSQTKAHRDSLLLEGMRKVRFHDSILLLY